ncbi:MAG: hypothetical protein GXX81_12645 [Acidobacteria bacterium]|nr:hypothetical protein [Acidobacteriota bacterium]
MHNIPAAYLLSLNPTSYGIYKNLRDTPFPLHLYHKGGGLEPLLGKDIILHRLSIEDEPEAVVHDLLQAHAASGATPIIMASSDYELAFMEKYRKDLEPAVSLPLPSPEISRLANNKHAFYTKMRETGIRSPRSHFLDILNSAVLPTDMRWPILIKPIHSHEWKTTVASRAIRGRKVFVIRKPEEWSSLQATIRKFSSELLAQEIIDASEDGHYSYCCYADKSGKVLWGFVTQKILQYPENFGTALLCRTVDRPDIETFGRRTIETVGLPGVSETEVVIDRNTGELSALEINSRHWIQHRLSTRLGVNISLLDYFYRSGQRTMVEEILSGSGPFKHVLWIDDFGYLTHLAKNFFRLRRLHLPAFFKNSLEFSYMEKSKLAPFLSMLMRRLLPLR